jgi:hypothetical protein
MLSNMIKLLMMTPAEIRSELRGQRDLPQVRAVLALVAGQRDQDQAALIAPVLSDAQRHYYAGSVAAMTLLAEDLERALATENPAQR